MTHTSQYHIFHHHTPSLTHPLLHSHVPDKQEQATHLHVHLEDLIGRLLQSLGDGAQHEGESGGVEIEETRHDFLTDSADIGTLRLRGGL